MKKFILLYLLVFFFFAAQAQLTPDLAVEAPGSPVLSASNYAAQFAANITAAELKSHIEALASDEFEGRETGTEGQRKAAGFIASYLQKIGLPPIGQDSSFFQRIIFSSESWHNGQIELKLNGQHYRYLSDFVSFPSTNSNRDEFSTNEVIFLGYGIDDPKYSDYKGVNVKGKTILIHKAEPVDEEGISRLTGQPTPSEWSLDWRKKLEAAYQHGVSMVLIIDPAVKSTVNLYRSTLLNSRQQMGEGGLPEGRYANNAFISSELVEKIAGSSSAKLAQLEEEIKKTGKPAHLQLSCNLEMMQKKDLRQLIGSNVFGFIEGRDPKLKDEIVVVSAHYDHLGKRGNSIYYGADDNASGTSAVMEIARAFAEAKRQGHGPRRSVLCIFFSGEEKGLLGSEFYSEHPVFPLENTVADVNVDMIGRTDKVHEGNPNYIYVIGSNRLSTELHDINEAANATFTQLELDYTFNARNDPNRFYYRSDHYNFAKKGIPSIFYFSGVHKDYHQPGDTADKIMFDKTEKVAKLIFHTVWELANRDGRIKVNVKGQD